jgi:hypothetical protein
VSAILQEQAHPSGEAILQRLRGELNRVCLTSHQREAFLRHPTQVPFLQDVWYTGQRNEAVVEKVRDKLHACVQTLEETPLWEELRVLPEEDVLVLDSLATFHFAKTLVFAAPDLVYRPGPERVVIVDFKTGSDDSVAEGIELQVPLYALYLIYGAGLTFTEGRWQGRVLSLLTGEEWWCDITGADLARAAERIRDGIAVMQSLLADPARNIPLGIEAFPLTEPRRRAQCPRCVFYQLCREQLQEEARQRLPAARAETPHPEMGY